MVRDGMRLSRDVARLFGCDAVVVAGDEAHLMRRLGGAPRGPRCGVSSRADRYRDPHHAAHAARRAARTDVVRSQLQPPRRRPPEPVKRLRGRIIADLAIDPAQFDRVVAAPTPIGTSTDRDRHRSGVTARNGRGVAHRGGDARARASDARDAARHAARRQRSARACDGARTR